MVGHADQVRVRPGAGAGRAPGTGRRSALTDKGIARVAEIVAAVREAVGWDVSLCIDHFGHGYLTANEVIRLGDALEPYGLAWMEDPMPWWDVDGHKQVTDAIERAHRRRRGHLPVGWLPRVDREARRRHHPPRPADLGRHAGDQEDRRLRRALRHAHRAALRRLAHRASWPTCTAPRPSRALSRWSTTASTCPSGTAWSPAWTIRCMEDGYVDGAGEAGPGRGPELRGHRGQPALPAASSSRPTSGTRPSWASGSRTGAGIGNTGFCARKRHERMPSHGEIRSPERGVWPIADALY